MYTSIYNMNAAVNDISKYVASGADAKLGAQYSAEIKVMQSFLLFNLSRLWGNVFIPVTEQPAELYELNVSTKDEIMDLGAEKEVYAIQVNYYEHKANQTGKAFDIYHQYKIYKSDDGVNWELAVDKSDNGYDVPHDYVELKKPMKTRFLKIENIHSASGNFALMPKRFRSFRG